MVSDYIWKYIQNKVLHWRHNGRDGVSNHQPYDCLVNRLFGHRSKKTSKLRVTGLCEGNSLGTGKIPAQMASNAKNICIWWRHHKSPSYQYKVSNYRYEIIVRPSLHHKQTKNTVWECMLSNVCSIFNSRNLSDITIWISNYSFCTI